MIADRHLNRDSTCGNTTPHLWIVSMSALQFLCGRAHKAYDAFRDATSQINFLGLLKVLSFWRAGDVYLSQAGLDRRLSILSRISPFAAVTQRDKGKEGSK